MTQATHPTPGKPLSDEWIRHDGKYVPVRGVLVDVQTVGTGEWSGWTADQWGQSWLWEEGEESDADDIIAYRIARPTPVGGDQEAQPSPAASGWRPIETAPRDGERVIGLLKSGRAVTVTCRKHHNGWIAQPGGGHVPNGILDDVWCEEESSAFVPRSPTHWMPLPPAPTPTQGDNHDQ
jgi:hypothetical protein